MTARPLILLVNDDGIASPGLAAAAAALDPLGDLVICAPSVQQSGMGRSFPVTNDGMITARTISYNGQSWPAYAANASPAQAVQHGFLELVDRPPALVVAGINYGENVGTGVTASGTVGAALEAASNGFPALAVSLQTTMAQHFSNDDSVDFSAAIHFLRLFAARWLAADRPAEIDVLKLDVPANATPDTPWKLTHLERQPYFIPRPTPRDDLDGKGRPGYMQNPDAGTDPGSDAETVQSGYVS
ncbi:MAG: 5'/3'-nucleotidase SurE, partial [Anaerolineae bacterium]|nr:5'/3'-nucleotidase SurE [Anaerolineae bacterium]